LILITIGVFLWFHLYTTLPPWMTYEGRKGSLWELFGWIVLAIAGIKQALWITGKLKRQFGESQD
jgi:hypothetical protein